MKNISKKFGLLKSLGTNGKVELDLSNYATKADLKHARNANISDFAKNNWLS